MSARWIILATVAATLAACSGGNWGPAPNAKNPYDFGDKYVDKNGQPLPGWGYIRDAATGEGM